MKKTPRSVQCIEKCGGQYKYFGIRKYIKQVTKCGKLKSGINDIFFNVDGLFLFKSSSCQLWPILCNSLDFNIHFKCLFCGSGKSYPVEEYLEDLIYELVEIQNKLYHCEHVDYTFRINLHVAHQLELF